MCSLKNEWFAVGAALMVSLAADWYTKMLVSAHFCIEGGGRVVIPGFLSFTYRRNPGIAFSLFHDTPWAPIIFSVISAGAILFIAWMIRRHPGLPMKVRIALGCIAGGAAGNLIDRVRHPHTVIDFIDCYLGTRHWPAFNIADSAIFIGAALLILSSFTDPQAFADRQKSPVQTPSDCPR